MKFSKNKLCMLKLAVAGASALGAQAALAQDFFFIEHKPTDLRFHSCSDVDGTAVTAEAGSTSACAHWQQVPVGDFFFIKSRTGKHIRPDSADNGSPIVLRPNTWTGNWAQWSIVDKGEFGHLKNRATGKYVFIPAGGDGQNLEQQPSTWQGDYTQWKFIPVGSTPDVTATPTVTPTATVTPTTTPTATPTITATPTVTPTAVVTSTPTATPTPACTSIPASTTSYEAESGALTGSARTYDDSAASGGQGVAFLSELGASVSITNVQPGSSFDVTYASQAAGSISYSINGADAGNITFETTGNWTGAYNTVTVNADIPQNATIEIFYDNGDAAMNVDKISVTSEGSNCGGNPTVTPTATPTSDPVGNTVNVSNSAEFGNFLVAGPEYGDKANFTLYTWDRDNGGPQSNCNSTGCLNAWPPLVVDSADDVVAPEGVNLSTTIRQDDRIQVTLNNEPLYFFAGDREIGDTNGHGLDEGTWLVADLDGPVVTPTPTPTVTVTPTPTPTPTPPTGGGSSDGDFCLTMDGKVTHVDLPFRANYHFLCLNGQCLDASLENGVWVRQFDSVTAGQNYQIKTQLDHSTGECGIEHTVQPGQCVASSCLPPDEEAPTVPTNLTGEGRNGQAALLNWTASTDNRAIAKYEIFRNGELVGESTSTTYNDSGLNALTTYEYTVRACDAAPNCSAQSFPIDVDTGIFVPDETAPTVPGQPTGEAVSETEITVSWAASTDAAGVVDLYELRRNDTVIATLNATSFEDSGLRTATSYSYTVRARDNSGNWSAFSPAGVIETQRPDFSFLDFTTNSHPGAHVGPAPRADRPDALSTPINGAAPAPRGFAFDISGNTLTWRWGSNNIPQGTPGDVGFTRTAGDSDLEMYCSEDDNKTFKSAKLSNLTLTIPCEGVYTYFFRYKHPLALSSLAGTDWIHTALFTTASRVDVNNYNGFIDGSSNWMRWRHPVAHDGCTAAVSDACHNNSLLRVLDRYTIWFDDSPGNVQLNHMVDGGILRVEAARHHAGNSNGQQQFTYNQGTGFGGEFSYGQVIQFELTALAGSQVYNDFSYYTVGLGWGNYGDPRLNMAGRAGTTMIIAGAPGADIFDEQEAIFTQPLVTVHHEALMNDFIVGHHLFHGIDPNTLRGEHDQVKIGERTCGNCHFRDGRGSEVINTPRGPRLPPPVYGVKLLEWMEGRETGFRWDGGADTVEEQIHNAFREDHGVNPNHLPPRVLETIVNYTEVLTVPSRRPAVYDDPSIARGDIVFNEIGCASCHLPKARTRADAPTHIRNINIRPYTDMKLWDLGDGEKYRTPALWGLSHNLTLLTSRGRDVRYMHDGASRTIEDAISRHNVDGAASKANFNGLSGSDKKAVVDFVESL